MPHATSASAQRRRWPSARRPGSSGRHSSSARRWTGRQRFTPAPTATPCAPGSPAVADDQPGRGRLATDIADLGWLGELIGEGWQTGGRLQGEATLAGTPRRPLLNGRWQGEALALGLPDQGLQLTDGTLAARLDDNRLRVERL